MYVDALNTTAKTLTIWLKLTMTHEIYVAAVIAQPRIRLEVPGTSEGALQLMDDYVGIH